MTFPRRIHPLVGCLDFDFMCRSEEVERLGLDKLSLEELQATISSPETPGYIRASARDAVELRGMGDLDKRSAA